MKRTVLFLALLGLLLSATRSGAQSGWRSALYPENWTPGMIDAEGRFLHDFSYAGYHGGMKPIPHVEGPVVIDITSKGYGADNTGKKDVTRILQRAIDAVGSKGGGVVYIPAGTYRVSVPDEEKSGIVIRRDNVVIRGAGPDKTFIKNTTTSMRSKTLFHFSGEKGSWTKPIGERVLLTEDVLLPTHMLHVASTEPFKAGDLVVVTHTMTDAYIDEHHCEGYWDAKRIHPLRLLRTVTAVDPAAKTITIDIPTRYLLKLRDQACVYKVGPQLTECGIEQLSVGNVQHPESDPKIWANQEIYTKSGTGPHDVHYSHLIIFDHAENCWARGVSTFRPEENRDEIHALSNVLILQYSRYVTIENCDLRRPQYEGGGGNGYMYTFSGANDCLVTKCHAEHARHNYDFKRLSACGNVIHKCTSKDPSLATDFHMHMSVANLIDGFVSEGDFIHADFRPSGSQGSYHMYSASQCVIWNTRSIKPYSNPRRDALIYSRQFGHGYVVGTSGVAARVETTPVADTITRRPSGAPPRVFVYDTSPEDWVEGVGKGETLVPQSLYEDQLARRMARTGN